jgi:hypothetical protein
MENSAIEICTNDIADNLGLSNYSDSYIDDNKYHVDITVRGTKKTYTDLKTYDDIYDQINNRTRQLCIETKDTDLKKTVAYPMCSSSFNEPGYIKLPSNLSKCIAYDCPPNWERSTIYCKKPLIDAIIDKRSKCSERWYDWFVIPNYHLGNNFIQGSNVGTCYAPCKPDYVPNYTNDPVNGYSQFTSGFSNNENIDKCISKTDYLMGKYANTPEFCPLAWVHRMGYTTNHGNDHLKEKLTKLYNANNATIQVDSNSYDPKSITNYKNSFVSSDPFYYMLKEDNQNNVKISSFDDDISNSSNISNSNLINIANPKNTDIYNKVLSTIGLTNTTANIINSIGNYLDNIPDKFDVATCDACNSLSTPDRLNEAYDFCKHLNTNPEIDDGTPQYQVLKQSCNALFCDKLLTNYNSNANDIITTESICFLTKQITDQNVPKNDDPNPIKTDAGRKNIGYSMGIAISIIIAPIVIVVLIILFKKVIWPYILKPLFIKLVYWFANIGDLPSSLLQSFRASHAQNKK